MQRKYEGREEIKPKFMLLNMDLPDIPTEVC